MYAHCLKKKKYKLVSNLQYKFPLPPEKSVGKLLENILGEHTCTSASKAVGRSYCQGLKYWDTDTIQSGENQEQQATM